MFAYLERGIHLIKLIKLLRGYLVIRVTGFSPERLLNLCTHRGILLWHIHKDQAGYSFCISVKGFRMLRPLVKKTRTKVVIIDKIGVPFFFYKYRKRKLFFTGIGIFGISLYILSLFIWKIEINGNYTYTDEMFLKYLAKHAYSVGMRKNQVKSSDIEQAIMTDFEDVAWVSCQVTGTKLILNFQETLENYEEVKEEVPCDIIAEKDGVITSIVTKAGTPQVVKGDVVKKGDTLVLSDLLIKMEEVLKDVEFAHSEADIYAKTIYAYEEIIDLDYEEKLWTGRTKKSYAIRLFNREVVIFHPRIKYSKYDKIMKSEALRIGKDFYLPFEWVQLEYNEYDLAKKKYTDAEAKAILQEHLLKYVEKLEEKGVQILENNVKIEKEDQALKATGKIIVIEEIGFDVPINTDERRLEYEDEIIREEDTDSQ